MPGPSLGDQELDLLRYVTEHGPVTVGEVAEGFGVPLGLTRSTVVTVMERLRQKGYLARGKQEGIYHYSAPLPQEEILGGLIQQFVEKTLAGSLTPFVGYFSKANRLSPAEIVELQRMLEKLQSQDKEEEQP
ncbi:MAG TPA: BlaI/MecI/CopY family transcriptional regulator [Chthonomonadaceae bacterium]|nr:BlaI/MecI/CopY family transcriptional regulator [Chthonomonadaceae bacterium]